MNYLVTPYANHFWLSQNFVIIYGNPLPIQMFLNHQKDKRVKVKNYFWNIFGSWSRLCEQIST